MGKPLYTLSCGDQLQHKTYSSSGDRLSDLSVELYRVRYRPTSEDDNADQQRVVSDSDEDASYERPAAAKAVLIHKVALSPQFAGIFLTNRGGLSARDGWMCWSAVDRVLCGRLTSSGSVVEVKTRLHREAVDGDICRGMLQFYSPDSPLTVCVAYYHSCQYKTTRHRDTLLLIF